MSHTKGAESVNGTNGHTNEHTNGHTNGYTNGNDVSRSGLKVLIAGAGIGGLTAAIALRQQGHNVEVSSIMLEYRSFLADQSQIFESSRFAKETGAAIHIPPNAYGILKRLGIEGLDIGANECNNVRP